MKSRTKTKKINKIILKMLKEKQKTWKANEKIRRKAAKGRMKKIEKNVDRILVGGCFLVCLTAAFLETKELVKESQ